jgi:hypothetical protein
MVVQSERSAAAADGFWSRQEIGPAIGFLARRLGDDWRVLRDRRLSARGEQCLVEAILLHRDYGIGLISLCPPEYAAPDLSIRVVRSILAEAGFDQRFKGYLPIVFVTAEPDTMREAAGRLMRSFAMAPLEVRDPSWFSEVAELLAAPEFAMLEDDWSADRNGARAEPAATARRRGGSRMRRLLLHVSIAAGCIAAGAAIATLGPTLWNGASPPVSPPEAISAGAGSADTASGFSGSAR